MKRVVEPELMETEEQAAAYAAADFEAAHARYPEWFDERFPSRPARALVLDLGCGPCDVTLRFARANPGYRIHALDGSAAMLRHARRALRRSGMSKRIKLIRGFIPDAEPPARRYDVILSSSLLHHLHDPAGLWRTVRERAKRGATVFVADLRRPASRARARALVRRYSAATEPDVLRRDFLNSLLAAFTPAEVRRQLRAAGLPELRVKAMGDRHLLVCGRVR